MDPLETSFGQLEAYWPRNARELSTICSRWTEQASMLASIFVKQHWSCLNAPLRRIDDD